MSKFSTTVLNTVWIVKKTVSVRGAFWLLANDSPQYCLTEFGKVVSVVHHRPETSGRWVWTIWPCSPQICATTGKCCYFWVLHFFCQPPGSLVHRKNHCHNVPNGKTRTLVLFCLFVFAAIASLWCWRRLRLCRRRGPSNQTDTWTKRRHRWVGKGLTVCLCKHAHEGERVTGQLSHNILAAHAHNGTWPTRKTLCVCLTTRASVVNGVLRFWVRFELVTVGVLPILGG